MDAQKDIHFSLSIKRKSIQNPSDIEYEHHSGKKKLTQFKTSFPYYITIRNNYLHCALYFSNFLITITSFNIPKLKEKRGNYYFGFEKKKTQSQAGLIICLSPLKSSIESELIV